MFVGPRARRSYCCARTQGMKNMKTFNEIFIDKTKCGVKVRTSEYKERGRSIIVGFSPCQEPTCLAIPKHMEAYPTDDKIVFDGGDTSVRDTWTGYVSDGDAILAEPEDYMILR